MSNIPPTDPKGNLGRIMKLIRNHITTIEEMKPLQQLEHADLLVKYARVLQELDKKNFIGAADYLKMSKEELLAKFKEAQKVIKNSKPDLFGPPDSLEDDESQ